MEIDSNKKSIKENINLASDFILNIITNNDGSVHGEIQHCKSGETKYFRSLIELLLLINGKLDQFQLLHSTSQIRSWSIRSNSSILKKGGKVV